MSASRQERRARAAHLGPERRRPEVLDVALGLFRRNGYEATSMEMIARAARVTRPVVYACFPSKGELFRALLDREERRLVRQIAAALPRKPNLSDPEQTLIDGFVGVLTAAHVAPDSWGAIFLSEHTHPEIAARVETARGEVRSRLAELAGPILAARAIADPDGSLGRLVAHLLMGNAEAAARLMLTGTDEWEPRSLGRLVGRMVTPALDVLGSEGSA